MTPYSFKITCLVVILSVGLPTAALGKKRRRKPGKIKVESITTGAEVLVDGKSRGHLPLDPIEVRPGKHVVELVKLGHFPFSERVRVRAGRTVTVVGDLLPFAGVVTVNSMPAGAEVTLGEKVLGITPLDDLEVLPGVHELLVSLEGYRLYSQTLDVAVGEFYQIRATLLKDTDTGEGDAVALVGLSGDAAEAPMTLAEEAALAAPLAAVTPSSLEPVDQGPKFWTESWFWPSVGAGTAVVLTAVLVGALSSGERAVLDCTPVGGVQGHIGLGSCGQ